MLRQLTLLILCIVPVSCISSRTTHFSSTDTVLAVRPIEGGGTATWRLYSGNSDDPTLERTIERKYEVARIGVRAISLDDASAERLGQKPWEGVLLTTVQKGTAAERAGLRIDEVVVSVNGRPITSQEQFTSLIERDIAPGQSVELVVRRSAGDAGFAERVVTIAPDAREMSDTSLEPFALPGSKLVAGLTGLRTGELTAELASAALGLDAGTVLVAGVTPGSPAYLGGLRAGDRIVSVDGRAVRSLDDVRAPVITRARELGIALDTAEGAAASFVRVADGPLEFKVTGALGDHTARVDVRGDLTEYHDFDVPILFECDSNVASLNWSLLDFIFQFGANYRRQYLEASTRKPAEYKFFSMLPFGFYESETRPGNTRYCILWFIEWNTKR